MGPDAVENEYEYTSWLVNVQSKSLCLCLGEGYNSSSILENWKLFNQLLPSSTKKWKAAVELDTVEETFSINFWHDKRVRSTK